MIVTTKQWQALRAAYRRANGCVCPVAGVHDAAETAVVRALQRRGLVDTEPCPQITESGRAFVAAGIP